ncbi:hypothetical protein H6G96_22660 [Nostoc sp. FACHB-892]|uniref:hypothetical protein n=1 Tax=Nostoc sp. FACHB-892 TaxID=2692843 RepID=UPI0016833C70|nr:hypothetical protein [Nostoc sp. FACHB-892]MBD2729037.1 hypothetical protein [Nostoc sp. FACHB-892]
MLDPNTDSHLLSWVMNADINQIQQIHQALTLRLSGKVCEHDRRISALENRIDKLETTSSLNEAQLQECQDSVSFLKTEMRYTVSRNEDLQNLVDFHCPPE